MSVLLEGLQFPHGNPITINIYRDGSWCDAYTTEDGKAIEVPTPHGDLIDQYEAVKIAMEWCPDDDGSVGKIGDLRELLDEIEAMPTIVEAEE